MAQHGTSLSSTQKAARQGYGTAVPRVDLLEAHLIHRLQARDREALQQ